MYRNLYCHVFIAYTIIYTFIFKHACDVCVVCNNMSVDVPSLNSKMVHSFTLYILP